MIRFTKARLGKPTIVPTVKGGKKSEILRRLRSFLDDEEPQTIQWLVSLWGTQSKAVTYKELKEAVLSGDISPNQLEAWQKEYAKFVTDKLAPQWEKAMSAAAASVKAQYPKFLYDPAVAGATNYARQHGAELVAALAVEQRDALRAMIVQATGYMTPDELARIMRPAIGLTVPQAKANLNYWAAAWDSGVEAGLSEKAATKRANQMAATYAAKQHRYRAQNIARTELAKAYNQGHFDATRDAQIKGYIGDCKKTWLTAYDERVCEFCGGVDGESVNMNDTFSNGVKLPPAHPSCRCSVIYEEITDSITIGTTNGEMSAESADITMEIDEQQRIRNKYDSEMLRRLETPQKPGQFVDEWYDGYYDTEAVKPSDAPTETEGRIVLYTTSSDWGDYIADRNAFERNVSRKRLLKEMNELQSIMAPNDTTLYRAEEVNSRHDGIAVGSTLTRENVQSWSRSKTFADIFLRGEMPESFAGDSMDTAWIVFKTKGMHRDINIAGYSYFTDQEESLMSGTLKVTEITSLLNGLVRLVEVEVQDQPGNGVKKGNSKQAGTRRPTMRDRWTDPDYAQDGYFEKFDKTIKARTFAQIQKER